MYNLDLIVHIIYPRTIQSDRPANIIYPRSVQSWRAASIIYPRSVQSWRPACAALFGRRRPTRSTGLVVERNQKGLLPQKITLSVSPVRQYLTLFTSLLCPVINGYFVRKYETNKLRSDRDNKDFKPKKIMIEHHVVVSIFPSWYIQSLFKVNFPMTRAVCRLVITS